MLSKGKRRRITKKYKKTGLCAGKILGAAALFVVLLLCFFLIVNRREKEEKQTDFQLPPIDLNVQLLDVNEYSRPGIPLKKVRGIVVHYTANPGTDAMANRNYFNNLPRINEKKEEKTYVSSHFVIGLDGTIVQCIPTEEIAYASNDRNQDTVSIECCHKNKSGKFTKETYKSLVNLTTYLCLKFELTERDLIRHYDITGKICPKYFVEHPEGWEMFQKQVGEKLEKY